MKRIVSLMLFAAMLFSAACAAEFEVAGISKYGNAVLNVTADTFEAMGFELGDDVTVQAGEFSADMPYLDGFYVYTGEYLLRRTGDGELDVCISHGNFSENAGVGLGDAVHISVKEEGGSLALQGTGALKYTDERADYESDEIFANFRMITSGNIAPGRLYRAASPINNDRSRAAVSNKLIEAADIRTVMNMADSAESIAEHAAAEGFDSPYYMDLYAQGRVVALDMDVNFQSEDFSAKLVKGLSFLAGQEGPFLVHCNEGKDRAGFASAVISALMGASAEEIAADYMASYENYYHMDSEGDAERYALIMDGNIMQMLRHIAGIEKDAPLDGVDLAKAAEEYLIERGMETQAIAQLRQKLSA